MVEAVVAPSVGSVGDLVAGNGDRPSLPDRPTVVWTALERKPRVRNSKQKIRVDIVKVRQLVCVGHPTGEHCCFVTRPNGQRNSHKAQTRATGSRATERSEGASPTSEARREESLAEQSEMTTILTKECIKRA